MQKPSIGRIVLYVVSEYDAVYASERRSEHAFPQGINLPQPGDILPLIICRVWPPELYHGNPTINGQIMLDGGGSIWKTSVHLDDSKEPGTWHWPEVAATRPLTHAQFCQEQVVAKPPASAAADASPDLSAAVTLTQLELKARRLCHLIESLGASPDLTLASVTCANIREGLACLVEDTPPSPYLRAWLNGQSDTGTPPSGPDV